METTGRNDPCPCRSGKKYKHCCIGAGRNIGPGAGAGGLQHTLQLAMSLTEMGQLPQAAALCRQILQANPAQADALHLLGLVTYRAGDAEAALGFLTDAVAAQPAFPEAHYHLGLLHMQLGQPEQAALHYQQAIALAPDFLEAHVNLGVVLNRQNAPRQALACFVRALSISEVVEAKIGAAECLQRLPPDQLSADLRPLLTRAIAQAWRRPEELAPAAIALLLAEPGRRALMEREGPLDALALSDWRDDALLLSLLESATVCDVTLEHGLTQWRAALLAEVLTTNRLDAAWLKLCSAMARQCFISEYAWICSPAETAQVDRLLEQVNAALGSARVPQADALLLLACYQPLHTLVNAEALLASDWPEVVRGVLRLQLEEPRREEVLRAELPRLTAIDDDVSCQVRDQYEDNPYPRWARSSLFPAPQAVDDRVRLQVPHARFRPLGPRDTLDVLVAGCGTGRHSTETAHLYRGARVLAIDLSASSLAYALRKSQMLGQRHIEYAQADILQLATLERRFDVIESVGVLHHLADPEAGWRALLPLLRPGGLMLIGLYSELARAPVVAARQFIIERSFPATAQGIRDCRAALTGCGCPDALKSLTAFGDFFGVSACRDLLFHEQEHRTSLPAIRALLDRLGLDFVGLHVEPSLLKRFQARFPQADAVHDLDLWHQYETEHPTSFVGMYQFWVQKRSA